MVEVLLEAGAHINQANATGQTPLYVATIWDNLAMVKMLLAADADVNLAEKHGETPLHHAANLGYTDIAKELLNVKEIKANTQNKDGNAPLHIAVMRKNLAFVKALLEHDDILSNQDLAIKNNQNHTAFDLLYERINEAGRFDDDDDEEMYQIFNSILYQVMGPGIDAEYISPKSGAKRKATSEPNDENKQKRSKLWKEETAQKTQGYACLSSDGVTSKDSFFAPPSQTPEKETPTSNAVCLSGRQ